MIEPGVLLRDDAGRFLGRIRDQIAKGMGPVILEGRLGEALPLLSQMGPTEAYVVTPDIDNDLAQGLTLDVSLCRPSSVGELLVDLADRVPIIVRLDLPADDPEAVTLLPPR